MKKTWLLLLILIFWWQSGVANAALIGERVQSRQVLRRTEVLVLTARKSIKVGHQYAGLGLAFSHQVYAKQLFGQGSYRQAIFHSLRARLLAVQVIMANKTNSPLYDAMYDRLEMRYSQVAPPQAELDRDLGLESKVWSDQAAAKRIDQLMAK